MITAQGHPDDHLQHAGEICLSCKEFWADQDLPARRMIAVRDSTGEVMSTEHGLPIVICPHCDGELILKHNK